MSAMSLPAEAVAAMSQAVAAYEPEATARVIANPKQMLSVLLEASRRALEAAAPHIVEAERVRLVASGEVPVNRVRASLGLPPYPEGEAS